MTKSLAACVATLTLLTLIPAAHADQTIVFLRHGEKPLRGLSNSTARV